MVNAEEARGVLAALGRLESADPREVLERLVALPVLSATGVVCTLGARGVVAAVRGSKAVVEIVNVAAAALRGAVRDTTGGRRLLHWLFCAGRRGPARPRRTPRR